MIKYFIDDRAFNKSDVSQFRLFFNNNVINIEIFFVYSIILDDFMKNGIVDFINNKIRFIKL